MSTPIIPAQKRNDADTTSSRPTADPAVGPSTTPMPQRVLDPAPEPRNRFGLSGAQVAGSALAATTSAVAASGLGVAGTLIGAASGPSSSRSAVPSMRTPSAPPAPDRHDRPPPSGRPGTRPGEVATRRRRPPGGDRGGIRRGAPAAERSAPPGGGEPSPRSSPGCSSPSAPSPSSSSSSATRSATPRDGGTTITARSPHEGSARARVEPAAVPAHSAPDAGPHAVERADAERDPVGRPRRPREHAHPGGAPTPTPTTRRPRTSPTPGTTPNRRSGDEA